jgi:hypothetical protein
MHARSLDQSPSLNVPSRFDPAGSGSFDRFAQQWPIRRLDTPPPGILGAVARGSFRLDATIGRSSGISKAFLIDHPT